MSDRSRLVVLALPTALTREGLRAHFASINLPITDVRLLTSKTGNSRRVGFVGFRNNVDAQHARDWFDGTWLAGSRIKVAFAEVTPPVTLRGASVFEIQVETVRSDNASHSTSSTAVRDEIQSPTEGSHKRSNTEEDTDATYLAKRVRRQVGVGINMPTNDGQCSTMVADPSLQEAPSSMAPYTPSSLTGSSREQTARLFLRNLAFTVTSNEIVAAFSEFGELKEVHVPHQDGQGNKGIAFVQFQDSKDADTARAAMDGKAFSGRLLHILPASLRPDAHGQGSDSTDGTTGNFSLRKKAKLLKQADQPFNWGSLYMNSDAIISSLATRHGTTKADLLRAGDSTAGARLALAESYIIQETKDFFQARGVDTAAFDRPGAQSRNTLLLKNLPTGSTDVTMRSLLSSFENVRRILVPPAGTVALIDCGSPDTATKIASSLAYRKLGNSVIYVERAPAQVWKDVEYTDNVQNTVASQDSRHLALDRTSPSAAEPTAFTCTLFVTRLPPNSSTATFKGLFQDLPGFTHVKLLHNRSTDTKPLPFLSGFVTFTSSDHAQRAKKAMNGHVIDGQTLLITEAKGAAEQRNISPSPRKQSTKILVKNLPFETKKEELRQIISAYGSIVSLRLPLNAQRRPRGFAFVQFRTSEEALAARQGLTQTHFLGRHMVVEDAE